MRQLLYHVGAVLILVCCINSVYAQAERHLSFNRGGSRAPRPTEDEQPVPPAVQTPTPSTVPSIPRAKTHEELIAEELQRRAEEQVRREEELQRRAEEEVRRAEELERRKAHQVLVEEELKRRAAAEVLVAEELQRRKDAEKLVEEELKRRAAEEASRKEELERRKTADVLVEEELQRRAQEEARRDEELKTRADAGTLLEQDQNPSSADLNSDRPASNPRLEVVTPVKRIRPTAIRRHRPVNRGGRGGSLSSRLASRNKRQDIILEEQIEQRNEEEQKHDQNLRMKEEIEIRQLESGIAHEAEGKEKHAQEAYQHELINKEREEIIRKLELERQMKEEEFRRIEEERKAKEFERMQNEKESIIKDQNRKKEMQREAYMHASEATRHLNNYSLVLTVSICTLIISMF